LGVAMKTLMTIGRLLVLGAAAPFQAYLLELRFFPLKFFAACGEAFEA